MSRKGNCLDNAVAKRFFLNLKMERVCQRNYVNPAEAKLDVANDIAGFCDCERLHSVLGNLPPSVHERAMAEKELSSCPKLLDHYRPPKALSEPVANSAASAMGFLLYTCDRPFAP